MFLKAYKDMYPDAKLVGVEGLDERKKAEGLTFDYLFDKEHRQMQFGPGGEVSASLDSADKDRLVLLSRDSKQRGRISP